MPRIRSLKPEYPQDELLAKVSRDARLMYPLLWLIADDEGRFRSNAALLKAGCFPYDEDIDVPRLRAILGELVGIGRVVEYEVAGQHYGYMPKFLKHQRIDHPTPSKIPGPPREEIAKNVGASRERLASDSRTPRETFAGDRDLDGIRMGSGSGPGGDQDGEPKPPPPVRSAPAAPPQPPARAVQNPPREEPDADLGLATARLLHSKIGGDFGACCQAVAEATAQGATAEQVRSHIAAMEESPVSPWDVKRAIRERFAPKHRDNGEVPYVQPDRSQPGQRPPQPIPDPYAKQDLEAFLASGFQSRTAWFASPQYAARIAERHKTS